MSTARSVTPVRAGAVTRWAADTDVLTVGFGCAGAAAAFVDPRAGFHQGGLRTAVDGAVLDVSGAVLPGLFAAGRAASGIHGEGHVSGTSLGDGTFFGRRAGVAAAGPVS